MRAVVVGASQVGSYLCEALSNGGYDVVLVELDKERASKVDETQDIRVIQANGCLASDLAKAGADKADFFLSMTHNDRTNITAAAVAKALGARCTIARIGDHRYGLTEPVDYRKTFGVDLFVNPQALCALELAKAILSGNQSLLGNFARGQVEMQQLRICAGSSLVGKSLQEAKLGNNVRVAYIERPSIARIPTADTVLESGDYVTLFGPSEDLWNLRTVFDPEDKKKTTKISIFGGSETAATLIRLLNNQHFRLRVFEKDREVCQQLASQFPYATIINGDATSLRLLEEEQVSESDYFIACTKDDEDNIMTGLQVAALGIEHVQVLINKPDYARILQKIRSTLGIEHVVSPRIATINELSHYLSTDPCIELATLPHNGGHVLEMLVHPKAPCVGKSIRELDLPPQVIIVGQLHNFQAHVPHADAVLSAGNRLLVIAHSTRLKELKKLISK